MDTSYYSDTDEWNINQKLYNALHFSPKLINSEFHIKFYCL